MSLIYESADDLAQALRRAAAAHEKEIGQEDPDWPTWYAKYLEREQAAHPRTVTVKGLPDRIDPKDLIATQPAEPPPDPEAGRNPDLDFFLRYGAGGDDG